MDGADAGTLAHRNYKMLQMEWEVMVGREELGTVQVELGVTFRVSE